MSCQEAAMRRLAEDEYRQHSNLLALMPPERLFVQRWLELFDRDAMRDVARQGERAHDVPLRTD